MEVMHLWQQQQEAWHQVVIARRTLRQALKAYKRAMKLNKAETTKHTELIIENIL